MFLFWKHYSVQFFLWRVQTDITTRIVILKLKYFWKGISKRYQ